MLKNLTKRNCLLLNISNKCLIRKTILDAIVPNLSKSSRLLCIAAVMPLYTEMFLAVNFFSKFHVLIILIGFY